MGLETGTYVNDLVTTNPTATDQVSEGDDHLRLVKNVLKATFPGMGGQLFQTTQRSTAYTVLYSDNTRQFLVDNSATATVTFSLPAGASITAGFMLAILPMTGASVLLDPNAAETINGGATLAVPANNRAIVYYTGTNWRADVVPMGFTGSHVFGGNIGVAGNASISGTLSVGGGLSVGGTASFSATVVSNAPLRALTSFYVGTTATLSGTVAMQNLLDLQNGQIQFPAAQNASAGANTLDDYEEGTWTPTLTFDTPGNLSVVYSTQVGTYTKKGREVTIHAEIVTTTFTHTTAAGSFRMGGIPFPKAASPSVFSVHISEAGGITVTADDDITGRIDSATQIVFTDGNTSYSNGVDTTEATTAVQKTIALTATYHV